MTFRTVAPHRTAVVLAGGGERVVAWQAGVLAGLADAGIDLRDARLVVATGEGARVAARLAAGVDPRSDADLIAAAATGAPVVLPVPAARAAGPRPPALRVAGAEEARRSATNAGLAAVVGVELVIVLDPIGDDPLAGALHEEVGLLEASGRTVAAVRATAADRAAMGADPASGRLAALAVAAGRGTGRLWASAPARRRLAVAA